MLGIALRAGLVPLVLGFTVVGCSSTQITVISEPAGAVVQDASDAGFGRLGITPIDAMELDKDVIRRVKELSFDNKYNGKAVVPIRLLVMKDGYIPQERTVYLHEGYKNPQGYEFTLEEDPTTVRFEKSGYKESMESASPSRSTYHATMDPTVPNPLPRN